MLAIPFQKTVDRLATFIERPILINRLLWSQIKQFQKIAYGRDEWQDYEKSVGAESKYYHQFIKTWRDPEKDRLIFAVLKYETEIHDCYRCEPDNDNQEVIIIEHIRPRWNVTFNFDGLCEEET